MREFRLVPIVLFATVTLLVLKVAGLVMAGGYTFASPRPARADDARPVKAGRSWAQDVLGYPDITSSVHGAPAKESPKPEADKTAPAAVPDGTPVKLDGPAISPAG